MTDVVPSATEYEPEPQFDDELDTASEEKTVAVPSPAEPPEAAGDPSI